LSEPEIQTEERINPIDNLSGWLDAKERDAGPEEQTGQSAEPASPAEPTVAEAPVATQPAVDWREVVIGDDVDHGFFKGKKVSEAIESYKHAERAKQEAERQRNETLKELETIRREREAEAAVRRVTGTQPQPEPTVSAEDLWFENPKEAARLIREQALAEARQASAEVIQAERAQQQYEQRQRAMFDTAHNAVTEVEKRYGLDRQRAEAVVAGTFSYLGMQESQTNDPSVWLNPENYLAVVRQMIGDPAPRTAPPTIPTTPVPELSDPPGSKRPAAVQQRSPEHPALTREEEQTRRALAKQFGLDPQRLIDRAANRTGGRTRG
jgi:hypothetical protein